jgi:hypothetical protein
MGFGTATAPAAANQPSPVTLSTSRHGALLQSVQPFARFAFVLDFKVRNIE